MAEKRNLSTGRQVERTMSLPPWVSSRTMSAMEGGHSSSPALGFRLKGRNDAFKHLLAILSGMTGVLDLAAVSLDTSACP